MKLLVAIAALPALVSAFDFYMLSQSWEPAFCATGNFPGCATPSPFMRTNLIIHGLWPDNNDGTYPSFCSNTTLSQDDINSVGVSTLQQYWPDVKTGGTTFVSNEWLKHGTCSGLNGAAYLQAAVNTEKRIGTSSVISKSVGKSVDAALIQASYDKLVGLQCKDGELNEVRSCWDLSFNQINCIDVGTCKGSVTIKGFKDSC
ncbi:Aste57867_669 [Aphanomyces stellatus]|uniref:Aste57867_669 protein n=1 Tax=Aphanomyces stellatus TaxID=120398 RepID=A0A485K881_9STRA|nr:hypothetical protein As57867_000668 [Aphanomyces stellatus]VFT77894.1 Aste57867_669 [Aphanomyces stellatus]